MSVTGKPTTLRPVIEIVALGSQCDLTTAPTQAVPPAAELPITIANALPAASAAMHTFVAKQVRRAVKNFTGNSTDRPPPTKQVRWGMVMVGQRSAAYLLQVSPAGRYKELLMAARAVSDVSETPNGVWESLPKPQNPAISAEEVLRQWAQLHKIPQGRLDNALTSVREVRAQVSAQC